MTPHTHDRHVVSSTWYVVSRRTGIPLLVGITRPASSPHMAWTVWTQITQRPRDCKRFVARRFKLTLEAVEGGGVSDVSVTPNTEEKP